MNSINRCTVPIFNLRTFVAAFAAAIAIAAVPASADAPIVATYQRQTITFSHVIQSGGVEAVGLSDPGLRALLRATGASLTWQPGNRYILITTAAPQVVSFAVGDRRYDVGPIALQASIAPFQRSGEVYLPLNELLRSLDVAMQRDGNANVLQPQLDSLDVRTAGNRADILLRAGAPLRARIVAQSDSELTYEFGGVGTTLAGTRAVNAGGIRSVAVSQSGSVRDPKTLVSVQLTRGAVHDDPRNNGGRDVVISFAGPAAAAPPAAVSAQNPQPGAAAGTMVTGVTVAPAGDGYAVTIAVSGDAGFAWHRLRDPDNRFWIDVRGQLQGPPIDTAEPDPIGALRVRQIDPATVRVALSLTGPKTLDVSPSTDGITIRVASSDVQDVASMARSGQGSAGSVVASSQQAPAVTPAPPGPPSSAWKFGASASAGTYVPRNPRLIVIDPGHGGSDRGSSRHGVDEATLALDMSRRLRDILVARGWQVKLTHDTDVDVYAPNDSAHDELQARVDVANNAGARLFVSIHANAFVNSGPYGTTVYISKSSDVALAQLVEAQLANDGTKDDGIVKSHLYVTLHTLMPAVLVETAFISNPSDFALLTSPAWRQKMAQLIADGIERYNRQYPVSGSHLQ